MANFATIEEATARARHMANQLLEPYLIEYVPAIEGLCPEFWSIRRYTVRTDKPKIRINPTRVRNF